MVCEVVAGSSAVCRHRGGCRRKKKALREDLFEYSIYKIAEATGWTLEYIRSLSVEDFEGMVAYLLLNVDLEKEAYDKAMNKMPKSNIKSGKGNVIDISDRLEKATLSGEKVIDLSGL